MKRVEERIVRAPDETKTPPQCRCLGKTAGLSVRTRAVVEYRYPMAGGRGGVGISLEHVYQCFDVVVRDLVVIREPHEVFAVSNVEHGKEIRERADVARVSYQAEVR